MNNQVAILLAGVMIAGSVLLATSMKSQTPAPEGTPSDGLPRDASPQPSLLVTPGSHDDMRMRRALDEATAEIQRLKYQVAALAASGPAPVDSAQFSKRRDRFLELKGLYSAGQATKEQAAELLSLSKDKRLMDVVVQDLTKTIAANPEDLSARMQLADVQSARIHTADSITERAALGREIRGQIGEVLSRDAEHWDARYMKAVGISHSQRTPQGRASAVREFDSLIELQQGRAPEPRFARTYGELARVHAADRNIDLARQALQQGIARYPDNKDLETQLASLPSE